MRPGIDQSVIRWMPFLVLLLGLWMTGAVQAAEGPEDGQAVADKIAEFTTKPIYNLDTDHLLTSLETYLEERPAIKALTITETIDDERLLTYYRQSGKAVYDRPIPDDLLKLQRFTAFSVFEGEQIGLVEVYYSGATGIRLSEEERAWLADHPRIRVHNESDWPPFNFAENGAPRGYSIDYMNLLAERVGLQVEYVTGPSWNEFMGMMRSGELDVMLNIVKTPDRLEYLLFTPPYADNPNAILSRRGALYENLEQLSGKTVSLPKGFFFEEILKRDFPDIELNLVRNVLEAMKEVSFGRADAALGELAVLNHLLGEHMMTDLVVSGEVDLGDPELSLLNIATREDLPILASILTKGVESITLKEWRALRAKWLGVGERREPSAPSVALTPAERAWIEAHPKIRLASDPDFPPIEYFDENGEYVGLAADLVRMIAERTGIEIEIVRKRDWGEALEAFRNREVDMAGSMVEDDDTRQFMNFTTPYEEFPSVLIVRNDRQGSVRLADLAGQKVTVVSGWPEENWLRENHPEIEVIAVPDNVTGLDMVAFGDAEAMLGFLPTASYYITKRGMTNLRIAGRTDLAFADAIAARSDWPELISILQKGLDSISQTERLELTRRWIAVSGQDVAADAAEQAEAPRETSQTIQVFVALSVALLAVFGLIAFILTRSKQEGDIAAYFGAPGFRLAILAGLSVLVAVVAIMNWLAITDSRDRSVEKIKRELQIVLHTSIDGLNMWVRDREAFLEQLGRDPKLVGITRRLLSTARDPETLAQSQALADARVFFASNELFGSTGFFIIAPDRISIGSRRDANVGTRNFIADIRPDLIDRAFGGEPVFVPPIRSDVQIGSASADADHQKPLTMFFAVPITDQSGAVLAVLTERILPSGPLSEILRFGRIGETGETYAFNAEAKMVSESRFIDQLREIELFDRGPGDSPEIDIRDPGGNLTEGYQPTAPLDQQPYTLMMADALRLREEGPNHDHAAHGHRGTDHPYNTDGYRDYRGVPVVGAWTWLKHLDFGLTSEVDHAEAYADYLLFRRNLVVISGLATLLAVGATLFTLLLGQRAHRSLSRARDQLEIRVEERTHELVEKEGQLSLAMNSMFDGMYMLDKDMSYALFNEQYRNFMDLGSDLIHVGAPVEDVIRAHAVRGDYGDGDIDEIVEQRMEALASKDAGEREMRLAETSRVLHLRKAAIGAGGAVVTISDITERIEAER